MSKKQTLMRAVIATRCAWNDHVRAIALAQGIPDSYRTVFLFLGRNPGASQRHVAEFAGVTTSAVNQVVKSMAEEGYLLKQVDPTDKRNSRLYLTDVGEAAAARLRERLEASDDAITKMLGADKEAELITLLNQLTTYIRRDLI